MGTRPARPRPYLLRHARALSPLLLTCEHARSALPSAACVEPHEARVLRSHWGWDIGAWALTRELAGALAATAIGGRWSRLWIDLNRRVDDPTLVRREVEGAELSWNRRADAAEIERRWLACHAPYHEAVDRLIVRRLLRGIRPLILAVHTFTDELDGRRRGFDCGVLYEREEFLARRLGRGLRGSGLRVRYNEPYSGMAGMMYAADRHGKHHGLPCLELELNQALFRGAGAATRLAVAVADGLGALPPIGAG